MKSPITVFCVSASTDEPLQQALEDISGDASAEAIYTNARFWSLE